MADNQKFDTWRRLPVFSRIDLFIGTVDTDAQDFDKNTTAIRDLTNGGFRHLGKMHRVRISGKNCNRFHNCSL